MANKTLKYVLTKNNLPTAKEPYIGQFVSNGTTQLDAFAEKVCEGRTNVDAATMKLVLRTAFKHIMTDMAENVFRYNTGLLIFEPAIDGSLPSMDAPLTEENSLYVAVRLAPEFVREIALIVPTRDRDDAVSVKIDDVLDLEADKRQQVTGLKRFQITGKNGSATNEGEKLEIMDSKGIVIPCEVVNEEGFGQRITATAPSGIAAGKGYVILTTRGYATPDAETIKIKKQVTIVAASEPGNPDFGFDAVYSVHSGTTQGFTYQQSDGSMTLIGDHLDEVKTVEVTYVDKTMSEEQTVDASAGWEAESDTKAYLATTGFCSKAKIGSKLKLKIADAQHRAMTVEVEVVDE